MEPGEQKTLPEIELTKKAEEQAFQLWILLVIIVVAVVLITLTFLIFKKKKE